MTDVVGIYLAAGSSRRMGENKLSLPFENTTVGCMGLRTAILSELSHIIVVVKEDDELDWIDGDLLTDAYKERWSYVRCPEAKQGQAHSLRCGLYSAKKASGIMVLLADQPLLPLWVMNELLLQYKARRKTECIPFLAASYQGVIRPPVIFSNNMLPSLLQLEGDIGARQLLQGQHQWTIEYHEAESFLDIDTKAEYERVKGVIKHV